MFSSHHLHQVQQVCDRVGLFVNGKLLAEGDINSLSQKLFANSAFTIEAGVSGIFHSKSGNKLKTDTTERLTEVLQSIDGVIAVKKKNNLFHIECSRDLTPVIARAVIESGADLNYLNKKEYGLDDIYYRYFEGGLNNE